ncbi:MAG: hypothetical protein JXX29_04830 [Deltaproteobacteria bacterium]|nr:hypothetical protein [Deltaproteobacteria bacterium]MBN2670971.1 hypothetical protein [Deltaproteobacteria bacterium]
MKHGIKALIGFLILAHIPGIASAGLFDDAVSGNETDTAPASPVDSNGESTETVVQNPLTFDLNGYIRGDVFVGKMPRQPRAELKTGYGELALKLRAVKERMTDGFAELRLKGGYLNDETYLGQPTERSGGGESIGEFDTSIMLREAYVNLYLSRLELRLGQQIVVWGRADGINPTNSITPVDIRVRSPEEDDRRLANIGLRARLNLNPLRLEVVWMPIYVPSVMPKVALSDAIVFSDPVYPDFDVLNGLIAGKTHLIFSSFEMSLSYLYGFSLTPGLSLESYQLTDVPASVTVSRRAYKHHVVGADFSTTIASLFGLRGEAAFRYPTEKPSIRDQRIHVPKPDVYYVLGADKEIGNVLLIGQYIGRYVLDWETVPDGDSTIEEFINSLAMDLDLDHLDTVIQNYGFIPEETRSYMAYRELAVKNQLIHGHTEKIQHGASLRITWTTLHDTLSLVAFGMANFSTGEWLVYPKIAYKLVDDMTVSVGAELYMGPDDTLFGMIDQLQSAGYAEMKLSF